MTDAGLSPGTTVGRVALRVNDLEGTARFYERVVGLDVLSAGDDGATLGAGGRPLLELIADPDAPERRPDETGLFHLAVRVPTREALADALGRIEREWALDGASDHLVSEALYLADPENNGVEIYRDRPREAWPETPDGRVGMETLPLDLDGLRRPKSGADVVPADTDVGHVHLEVSDLAETRAFYTDALGMRVRQEYGDSACFLAAGDYHHHVGANVWNRRSVRSRGRGLAWFELRVPGDGRATLRDRLDSHGVDPTPTDDGLELVDPDGIVVRIRIAE